MKKTLVPLALLCLAIGAQATGIGWKKGYEAANAASKATGKLMMVDFYTDWCGWCKKLDADTYPAPAVVKESAKFIPIKLNAEKDTDGIRLAKKFKVDGYPTILFIDSNENVAYKIVGYEPAKQFADSMAQAATIRQDRARYGAALKGNPNDFRALVGMATIDASTGDLDKAAELVDRAAGHVSAGQRGKLLAAFNAVGDGYQNAGKPEAAIPYFSRAIQTGFPEPTAYARISIAECYAQAQKPKLAIPFLKALLRAGDGPKDYLAQAKTMLQEFEKQP